MKKLHLLVLLIIVSTASSLWSVPVPTYDPRRDLNLNNITFTINGDLQYRNIFVVGNSILDFGSTDYERIMAHNLIFEENSTLVIRNYQAYGDAFKVMNWVGGVANVSNSQIQFIGYHDSTSDIAHNSDSMWRIHGNAGCGLIVPVPEPSTYGAFMGAVLALLIVGRKFLRSKS